MGKTLFRFEDTYGMYTILAAFLKWPSTAASWYTFDDFYIQRASGNPGCLIFDEALRRRCVMYGITDIIVFCDTDSASGRGVMTPEEIDKALIKYKIPEGITFRYMPVAWCAETLILYQVLHLIDAEIYTVPRYIEAKLKELYGKSTDVKKTEGILQPVTLRIQLEELDVNILLDKAIINYILGREFRPMNLLEFKEWLLLAREKFDANYGWWKKEGIRL